MSTYTTTLRHIAWFTIVLTIGYALIVGHFLPDPWILDGIATTPTH